MTSKSRNPSVKIVNGKATTTSLKVAEVFVKDHWRVLRAIKNLECSQEFRDTNFVVSEYTDSLGKKKLPAYNITKDGFVFLAMGFTGEEAAQWKEKYIFAFNKLEERVHEKLAVKQRSKALPSPKKYNYPRKLLEQDHFITATRPASLNISMLGDKQYVSPLMHLLNELRVDGHEVSAAWDEAIAMRDGILQASDALEDIYMKALKSKFKPASTAGNKKEVS